MAFAEGKADDYEYKVRDMSQATIDFGRAEYDRTLCFAVWRAV